MGFFLLVVCIQAVISSCMADTNDQDYAALLALTHDWGNKPRSWNNPDPCSNWDGVSRINSRVTSMDLSYNKGLTGNLPQNIGELTQLETLILDGCGFSGSIPDSVGSLPQLFFLSLSSNSFSGNIPPSIGKLSNLYWLDLTDNQLTGSIPVSNGTTPGLDMLLHAKHFHLGKNKFSGTIPPNLFSSAMSLIHV
ncbi:hypothetical protein Ancab_026471 [Ancistrocladus abbreviatus]